MHLEICAGLFLEVLKPFEVFPDFQREEICICTICIIITAFNISSALFHKSNPWCPVVCPHRKAWMWYAVPWSNDVQPWLGNYDGRFSERSACAGGNGRSLARNPCWCKQNWRWCWKKRSCPNPCSSNPYVHQWWAPKTMNCLSWSQF